MINIKKFWEGLRLVAKTTLASDTKGELEVKDSDGKLNYHNGSSRSPVVTEGHAATLVSKTLVVASNTITTAASGNLVATELNAALAELDSDITNVGSDLGAHIVDPTDAHDASAISNIPAGNISATDVQAAINQNDTNLTSHLNDTVDAHDASAISNIPSGNLAATEVQAALNELQSDIDTRATQTALTTHINNTTGAHAASAISVTPSGNLGSTEVQAALVELQGDINTINAAGYVVGPASATDNHIARFDGTTGKLVQDGSPVVLSDAGALSALTGVSSSGTVVSTGIHQTSGTLVEDFSTDSSTTGANAAVASPSTPVVRLTNASLTSIDTIASPSAGRILTIVNATGASVTVNNDTGGTAANRILTGSQAAITLSDEASLILKYDSTESRWLVIGGTGSGAGASLNTIFQLTGTDVASWATGDNATFLGGGTLSGTFAANTTTPLNGISDYKYIQAAGSLNDYLASPVTSVATRFRGTTVTLTFPYLYDGATNDIEVLFYDVTNSALIPSSTFISGTGTTNTIFKTNITIPLTCASIRVGFQTRVLNSGKIFRFDDIVLSADSTVYASVNNVTSWTSYTPTFTGFGTATSIEFQWRQNGQNVDVRGKFTSGTSTAVEARVSLPNSYTSASTSIIPSIQVAGVGAFSVNFGGEPTVLIEPSVSYMTFGLQDSTRNGLTKVTGSGLLSSGNVCTMFASFPINGLTASNSNVLIAPDTFSTDTNALVYAGTAMTPTLLASAAIGTFITYTYTASSNARVQTNAAPTQTTSAMNTDGILITPRAYNVTGSSNTPATFQIQIGKALKGWTPVAFSSTGKTGEVFWNMFPFNASSTIEYGTVTSYDPQTGIFTIDAGINSQTTTTTRSLGITNGAGAVSTGYFTINASKNPALTGLNISAVAARGVNTAGTSISNAGSTTLVYDSTKTYDTHGALVAATGIFTAPESGYYQVNGAAFFQSAAYTAGNPIILDIQKNGSTISRGKYEDARTATYFVGSVVSDIIFLTKGDTANLLITNQRTGGSTSLNTSTGYNYFSIAKTSVG
jgi:hypothetical protein